MENLMRMQPDVAFSGKESLGNAKSVKHSADDVEEPHEDQPAEGLLADLVEPAFDEAVMDRGDNSAQAEGHEDSCTQGAQSGLAEFIPQADDDGAYAQCADNAQIHHLGPEVAVEAVIQPRDKRAHNQQSNSTII